MAKSKLTKKTVKQITDRVSSALKDQGITSLPEEDFDEKRATKSFNALLKSKETTNAFIFKEKVKK